MQALTADESFLSQRGGGQVEQVFTHAVNLLIPGKPGLLTLLCETSDNAPNSCRLALTHFDNLLRPGESVRFTDSGIYIGDNTWIDIHRCERWQTPQAVLNAATFSQIAWRRWRDIIVTQLHEDDTLFLYRGDNPFYHAMRHELQQRRETLFKALGENKNISAAVANMIGLGIGLTPSADDYLLGLIVILFIKGHPANQYREAFITALQSARQNTTPLSAITLEAAINQRYRESIAVLINLMVNQPTTFSIEAIADIKNIGSSSGSDMLLGMADACALSQTYGGNNVS
ncbi:TPA: DUF2877 domain-containing protein [Klebsiella aerogenes]|uniref:DUF2877 domain-containing protein n=1 Tax=Klebsiella aerogenes TaxID=548 RepID=UPI0005EE8F0B|nr:DUF2877 domain-containing protein [Klebsiella aerogenes]EKM7808877.1 DUF2877 domain-containing protein [Klebsiella aerogenes]EKU7552101.1 DUF2877 domain-containing protein [Klebsiella aerogenes]ELA0204672.1 DUF2877 domain-containing protein [Klebsiella aerogenes]ELA0225774.1 DUF2877 domain-containing protein [Klebsiella aerogenes]EMF0803516.1 DUF2877 domain-containing protein [Klebsiella aerogenes]